MTNNTQFKTLVNTWLNQKQPMITPSTHASFTLIAENHLIHQQQLDKVRRAEHRGAEHRHADLLPDDAEEVGKFDLVERDTADDRDARL